MNGIEELYNKRRELFFRWVILLCILILGFLSYYGLHRDIEQSKNPCVTAVNGEECAHYACGIGQYLPIPPSKTCVEVLAGPPEMHR